MTRTPDWSWKAEERAVNPRLRLAYEPGNWGDMLKALWAAPLVRALGSAPLALLDPFAGAPTWPLMPSARERLARLPADIAETLAPWTDRDLWPSTGRLLLELGAAGSRARVFDLDERRRDAWATEERAAVLPVADGRAALEHALAATAPTSAARDDPTAGTAPADGPSPSGDPTALTLLDPYDLFETHGELLPPALTWAERGPWLAYLYNKAPRSAAALRSYEQLRATLADWLAAHPEHGLLVGRLPADARLPRAWHEVALLARRDVLDAVREPALAATGDLARQLAAEGACEDVPPEA